MVALALSSSLWPSSSIASTGPVAAYSFDEGEGEVAEDLAGENDGEIKGAAWTTGRYGGALKFDGVDDCVSIPHASELQLAEEFTLQAWVKPEGSMDEDPVIFKQDVSTYSYLLGLGFDETGRVEAYEDDGEGAVSPQAIDAKVWTHIAATYDGAHVRVYVGGEQVASELVGPETMSSSGPLEIGCASVLENETKARIDEVRIYDRALDAGEVAADKATPIQTPRTGPVAAYSFDEGEGEVAEDLAGENDGALKSTEWVKGKYGSALYFDGDGDYVEIPDSAELQLTEEFTLQAWVRPDQEDDDAVVISKQASSAYSYQLFAGGKEDGVPEGFLASEPSVWDDIEAEGPLQPNTWSHLALIYDGGSLRLYVNGELVNTTESSPPAQASVGPLLFGGNQDEEDFEGRIDEVRVYDRALNEQEVADIKAPVFPAPFEVFAVNVPSLNQPVVSFQQAVDPPMPDGTPGSGVSEYIYRYAIQGEPLGFWSVTDQPYFEVTNEAEGKEITVEVYAIDAVGNHSERVKAATEVTVESFPPQTKEQEGFADEKEVDGPEETWQATGDEKEEEGEFSTFAEGPGGRVATCPPHLDSPHRSKHNPGRVNVIMRMECKGTMVSKGFITATLWRIKKGGKHEVIGYSGTVNFAGLFVDRKASANANCVTGWYRGFGGAFTEWSPTSIPPSRVGAFITKAVHVSC